MKYLCYLNLIIFTYQLDFIFAQSSCLQCFSENPGCDDGSISPTTCSQPDDPCYSMTISGGFELERGCLSDLSEQEQAMCRDSEDLRCQICSDGPGCNGERWHKCHHCATSTNNRCAFSPNRVVFCRNYSVEERCYAKVVGSETIRGCHSDLEVAVDPCEGNKYCVSCAGDACNSATQDDLKTVSRCLQCKEGDFWCVDGNAYNSECDAREDRCYIKLWEGKIDRGCVKKLDAEDQDRCNDEADSSCYSCTGKSCNNHRWLTCFQCDSEVDPSCAEEQTNGTLSRYCETFHLDDRCYAKIENFEVIRGCVSSLGANVDPCAGNPSCITCSSEACNAMSEAYIKKRNRKALLKHQNN